MDNMAATTMKINKPTHWDGKISYFLSIVGFVIGLGNFWLFPTMCYQYGGLAFLIPYFFFIVILGTPLIYLELLLGQAFRRAGMGIYMEMCPWLNGVAYTVIIMNMMRQFYYNTVIAWSLKLFFDSFQYELPWTSDATMNVSEDSMDGFYFMTDVLGANKSDGLHSIGGLHVDMIPYLILVCVGVYAAIYNGARSIGYTIYVTATLPYLFLIILLIKSLTLDGSSIGMRKLFKPDWVKLKLFSTWQRAAMQVCFSLGPGSGALIAYSSYSDNQSMSIRRYAIAVVMCNALTSIMCGLVLFAGIGHFSHVTGQDFHSFTNLKESIIFVVYPLVISKFSGSAYIFSMAFFAMIIMIGLNSAYAEIEGLFASLADRYTWLNSNPSKYKLWILIFCFLISLPSITFGGRYVVSFLVAYGIAPAVFLVLLAETAVSMWIYGYDKLVLKIRQNAGTDMPGLMMRIMWTVIVPILTVVIYISSFIPTEQVKRNSTEFGPVHVTKAAQTAGYVLSVITLLPVPVYAGLKLCRRFYRQSNHGLDKKSDGTSSDVGSYSEA